MRLPWAIAKWIVFAVSGGLVASMWLWPDQSLTVMWYVLIPILPATFLLNVELWRNVCPIATLNMLTDRAVGTRTLARKHLQVAAAIGIALLVLLVPARRLLFNTDASALGLTILAVGGLALVGGLLFDRKAGFCNSICPILPVERLYGQRPMVEVSNVRCAQCDACTRAGCLDLVPERSALITLGPKKASWRWIVTPFGAFALAFPGLVIAYYLLPDASPGDSALVYGTTLLCSAGSWALLGGTTVLTRTSAASALLMSGGLAAAFYYWFTPIGIADALGLPGAFVWGLRATALSLVAVWFMRGREARASARAPRIPG